VIVAHRASTVARVDTVIWLERGRLHALATHDKLWRAPAYRALFAPDDGSTPAPAPGAVMTVVT
jgi:ATP-binding cassette subfamily B protein